jgi:hypothetical protein
MEKVIGWRVYETIGEPVINPIVFVMNAIFRDKKTINPENISGLISLIKECISYVPKRRSDVLERIIRTFPEVKETIERIEKCGVLL